MPPAATQQPPCVWSVSSGSALRTPASSRPPRDPPSLRRDPPSLQNLVTFGGGLVVAFINGWKMTLVVLSCLPLIMVSAVIQTKARAARGGEGAHSQAYSAVRHCLHLQAPRASRSQPPLAVHPSLCPACCPAPPPQVIMASSSKEDETFASANQTASEAISNIRTIAAFGMEGQVSTCWQEAPLCGAKNGCNAPPAVASRRVAGRLAGAYHLCAPMACVPCRSPRSTPPSWTSRRRRRDTAPTPPASASASPNSSCLAVS